MAVAAAFAPRIAPSPAPVTALDADAGAHVAMLRAAEGFDHAAFALAAVLAFPALFFPYSGELLGTLYAAGLIALGFAVRPVGRWTAEFFPRFGGEPLGLVLAGAVLAACTIAIGVLPGYGVAGNLAALLLVVCRTGQGLAWGGIGSVRHAAPAWGGALVGVVAAAGLVGFIASQLVHADFVAWGWRYPFCAAVAVQLVALYMRLRLVRT